MVEAEPEGPPAEVEPLGDTAGEGAEAPGDMGAVGADGSVESGASGEQGLDPAVDLGAPAEAGLSGEEPVAPRHRYPLRKRAREGTAEGPRGKWVRRKLGFVGGYVRLRNRGFPLFVIHEGIGGVVGLPMARRGRRPAPSGGAFELLP